MKSAGSGGQGVWGSIGIVLLASVLHAGGASGQQVPRQLTLEEAQRIALRYSPTLRQAENDAAVSQAGIRSAYGRLLPNLSTNLGFGGSVSSTLRGTDPFGVPISQPRRVETESSSASQGISTGVTVFDGGANIRGISTAKSELKATEARTEDARVRLKASVARTFYDALAARQRVELELNVLAAKRDQLLRTERLLAVAASKYIDVLSLRADTATALQNVEDMRGTAEKQRLALKQVMGVEGPAEFELAGDAPAVFDPAVLNIEAIVTQALSASAPVIAAQANVAVADQRTSVARAARWPRLTLGGSFGRNTSASGYEAIGEFNPPNRSWGFNLGVSLPIFTNFTTSQQIAQADATEADQREALRQVRLTVDRDVRSALIDLQSAYRRVQIANQTAALRRELLAAAQEEYRLGTVPFFQLQQYADNAAQAERGVLDARFLFVQGLITLEERVGAPVAR